MQLFETKLVVQRSRRQLLNRDSKIPLAVGRCDCPAKLWPAKWKHWFKRTHFYGTVFSFQRRSRLASVFVRSLFHWNEWWRCARCSRRCASLANFSRRAANACERCDSMDLSVMNTLVGKQIGNQPERENIFGRRVGYCNTVKFIVLAWRLWRTPGVLPREDTAIGHEDGATSNPWRCAWIERAHRQASRQACRHGCNRFFDVRCPRFGRFRHFRTHAL